MSNTADRSPTLRTQPTSAARSVRSKVAARAKNVLQVLALSETLTIELDLVLVSLLWRVSTMHGQYDQAWEG